MNAPKQMINLLGLVVVVALLVAGMTLLAVPLYSSAGTIDGDARNVAQTNGLYEVRVAGLTDANNRIDEITSEVTALRREIAATPQLDDVMLIVVGAAESAGVSIEGVSAADPEPWMPRTGLGTDDEAAAQAPVDDPAAEPADGEAPAEDGTAPAEDAATAPTAEAAAEASPQKQVPLTITVNAPDARSAAAFMDALGRGPRLLLPIDGTLEGPVLTVTALAFIRSEE